MTVTIMIGKHANQMDIYDPTNDNDMIRLRPRSENELIQAVIDFDCSKQSDFYTKEITGIDSKWLFTLLFYHRLTMKLLIIV